MSKAIACPLTRQQQAIATFVSHATLSPPLCPGSLSTQLPDGQISPAADLRPCPAPFAKIFRFRRRANQFYESRRPVPNEGRFAIVTDVGNGMRWTLAALKTKARHADGEVVWS
jgi:hypothetical protein